MSNQETNRDILVRVDQKVTTVEREVSDIRDEMREMRKLWSSVSVNASRLEDAERRLDGLESAEPAEAPAPTRITNVRLGGAALGGGLGGGLLGFLMERLQAFLGG